LSHIPATRIPQNATWNLDGNYSNGGGRFSVRVFDADKTTTEVPVLNQTFIKGFTLLFKAVRGHLDAKGWLEAPFEANYMLFVDEVALEDPFTAHALLLLNRFMKGLEPRLMLARCSFLSSSQLPLATIRVADECWHGVLGFEQDFALPAPSIPPPTLDFCHAYANPA
jgi:hypothetical protein